MPTHLLGDKTLMWDDDALEYGYVLRQTSDGHWWHGHFGRAAFEYRSKLLGRWTNVFLSMSHFAPWAIRKAGPFYLTLDGMGVEGVDLAIDHHWGLDPADEELQAEARHLQQEVIPLAFGSPRFRRAILEVMNHRRYLRQASARSLRRP